MLKYSDRVNKKLEAIEAALRKNRPDFNEDETLQDQWEDWKSDHLFVDYIDMTMGDVDEDLTGLLSGKEAKSNDIYFVGFDGEILMCVSKAVMDSTPVRILGDFFATLKK